MPVNVRTDYAANYLAHLESTNLGSIDVIQMRHPAADFHRTAPLIRRADPETYNFVFLVSGRQQFTQARQTTEISCGSMLLYHASREFRTCAHPDVRSETAINIAMPRALLPLTDKKLAAMLGVELASKSALGTLVAQHLRLLATDAATYEATEAMRLSHITVDLLGLMLGRQAGTEAALPIETRENALLARINAFVQTHLSDPLLTPQSIAKAHHISVRTLYRLVETSDRDGVTGWIRQLRLDRCRHDLQDPQFRDRPVYVIAARWGFTNSAHFSRVFRAAFGVTPHTYRQQTASTSIASSRERAQSQRT